MGPMWLWGLFYFQTALTILLVILAEVGNMLTIVAVVKYRSLQRQQYFFIPSLAATDMLIGIVVAMTIPQVNLYTRHLYI